MARYRIGNDITVVWTVNDRNGDAFPLEDKDVHLYYTCERGRFEADIKIKDTNKIVWDFYGSLQKALGVYSLTLVILQSEGKRSIKKDICNAFTFVGKDCEADAPADYADGDLAVYQETITTDLDVCRINPIIPEIEEDEKGVGYWVIDGVNTGKIATVGVADWNADEGESGYIKNRTHYKEAVERTFVGIEKGDYILDAEGNPDGWESWVEAGGVEDEGAKVSLPVTISFGLYSRNFELTFDHVGQREILEHQESENFYASILEVGIDEKEGECYLYFTTRGCRSPWLSDGEEIDVRIESFKQLNDVYIPSTIARKSELEALQNTKIDKEADDYYPQLSVGTADNLSGVDEVDSEFSFRRSGGGAIADGVARVQSIKGNSVVWNQWAKSFEEAYEKPYNDEGITYNGNKVTIDNWRSYQPFRFDIKCSTAKDHLYLVLLNYANTNPDQLIFIEFGGENSIYQNIGNIAYFHRNIIYNNDYKDAFTLYVSDTMEGTVTLSDLQVIDLTKMFGAGNEPKTIEEYNARKPFVEDEYAYNEGEVIHMNAEGISSKGVNAWDEEWENGIYDGYGNKDNSYLSCIRCKNYIKILPNTQYVYSNIHNNDADYIKLYFYDADKKFIENNNTSIGVFNTPSNAEYLRFSINGSYGTTYKHDICIGISGDWDGYHAPIEASEDLSIVAKYFPNGMRSAGAAHDEIRYNKQKNKWEYSEGKIKTLRLADLVWHYAPTQGYFYSDDIDNLKSIEETKFNILCNVIVSCGWYPFTVNYSGNKATMIAAYTSNVGGSRVNILNTAYTDVSAFIAWLEEANATLYYESNDWEWVELDAEDQFKDLDYKVWNCGTEQMVASKPSSALSADITYGFNAVGLIKQLRSMLEALSAKVANL